MAGFRKAKPMQAALKLGLYGPPGSGKTFTALLIAEGLAKISGKRVAYVDTERGTDFYSQAVKERKVHPEAFDFDAMYTRSLAEVIAEVEKAVASHGVIVLDSITHLWEAAIAAYTGKQTRNGEIPLWAWGRIKKPYKALIAMLLSANVHVIICGRQGNEYEQSEDDPDKIQKVGVKMKAEGETAYEPHILARMEQVRGKDGALFPTAVVEKDRTGILAGKVIALPTFDNFCRPLLGLLGASQAEVPDADDTAANDAAVFQEQEKQRAEQSAKLLREFDALITLAKSPDELKEVGKKITPEIKKQMVPGDVTELREIYQLREKSYQT